MISIYIISLGGDNMILTKENITRALFEQYRQLLEEYIRISARYNALKFKNHFSLNDLNMNDTIKRAFTIYASTTEEELKLYNFILQNISKIKLDNLYHTLNLLNRDSASKTAYIEKALDDFSKALNQRGKGYFYISLQGVELLISTKAREQQQFLKGFNLDSVKSFLVSEQVYTESSINETLEQTKKYTKVIDEKSSLIAIKELVHNVRPMNPEVSSNSLVVLHEDLAIFYELLYQKQNPFSNLKIHRTKLSMKLLQEYKSEPFLEQVEKIKFYTKSKFN